MLVFSILGLGAIAANPCWADTKHPKQEKHMAFDYINQPPAFWKSNLSDEAYRVCREKGTEIAGSGQYDKFYEKGVYYCACCGGDYALFDSKAKYDSGTGWPSFWAPIDPSHINLHTEEDALSRLLGATTEVRCARCLSHLGHVFDDGPTDKTGKRYCMNSVALSFTPEGEKPKRTYPEP